MNKKNILLLAFLAVLVVIFIFSKGKENVERRFDLFNFKSDVVAKIEFIQPADTLIVTLENNNWMIQYPKNAPVKQTQLQRFFDEYLSLTASSIPISESANRQSFYQVDDSTATQITIYDRNNRVLSKTYYGRSQNPRIAYARADKDNKIYQINNVFTAINPSLAAWREDKIINITEEQISKISVGKKVDSFALMHEDGLWTVSHADSTNMISASNAEFNKIKNGIINLRTSVFIDNEYDDYAEILSDTELEILIQLNTGSDIHLKIAKIDDNAFVLQRNDEQSTLYRLTTHQFNQLNADHVKIFE